MEVTITVNGTAETLDIEPRQLLVHVLRENLRLTGTHIGCDSTSCGACTVLVDGTPIKSCTMFGVQADGREVTTVEGLLSAAGLDPIQAAFKEEHGLQCGYCTPGMMLVGKALIEQNPDAQRRRRPVGDLRQHLPLHRLHEHRQGDPGRGQDQRRRRADTRRRLNPRTPERRRATMATESEEIRGIGHSVRGVEDDRFIRGRGNYIDDITLPRHAAHGDPAQPVRPRQAERHRRERARRRCPAWSPSSPGS